MIMKKTLRLIGLVIIAIVCCGVTACGSDSASNSNQEETPIEELGDLYVDGIYYHFNTETKTADVIKYSYEGDIVIPSSVTLRGVNYSVTSIANNAFNGCKQVTSVTFPNSITSIGNYAFYH